MLLRVNEQTNILHEIRKRKVNWIGHILRRNCLLQQVIEGKIKGQIEVTRRRGRRRKKLLDELKDRRRYCQLKEETLDHTMRRKHFGRSFGLVVWQITDDDDRTKCLLQLSQKNTTVFCPVPDESSPHHRTLYFCKIQLILSCKGCHNYLANFLTMGFSSKMFYTFLIMSIFIKHSFLLQTWHDLQHKHLTLHASAAQCKNILSSVKYSVTAMLLLTTFLTLPKFTWTMQYEHEYEIIIINIYAYMTRV